MASQFQLQSQYKPHVRQEGFHLPSPPPTTDTPPPAHDSHSANLFAMGHGFHPNGPGLDLNDELASLINPQSNERSTQSPSGAAYEGGTPNDGFRPPPHTHNIFDISAPSHQHHHHVGSASSTSSSFPSHFSLPSAGGGGGAGGNANGANANANGNGGGGNGNGSGGGSPHGLGDAPQPGPQYHFNSTLPALNSSMRYDPHPHTSYIPSPSSFRSPSPHHSRSRSRSRPPSGHLGATPAGGPTRTTRTRRNGSISSTSPPPRPVPQAIVIPSNHGHNGGGNRGSPYTQSWFGVNGDYPHATPDSLPSLTSLPSLPSLGSINSIHTHGLGSPHSLHSPHTLGSPHAPFHGHGHGHGAYGGQYGSPVENKFGGMALGGVGMNGGMNGALGGMGGMGAMGGMPGSLGSVGGGNGTAGANGNGNVAPEREGKTAGESKAALLANEKRRRRRESHNAVERRRRDNINEKISELATLIPECLLESGTQPPKSPSPDDALLSPTSAGTGTGTAGDWPLVLPGTKKEADEDTKDGAKDGAVVKANKGMILRKSVEYIRYLQQLVTAQGARNRELEARLKGFRGSSGSASPPGGGELGLGLGGSGGGGAGGAAGGAWGLASMPEREDEEGEDGGEGEGGLHALEDEMEMGMGMMGMGMGGMGMEVDGEAVVAAADGEEKRGRKATRAGGAEGKGAGKASLKTSPRKAKKVLVDEDEEDVSELSEDGMDV
ncbi:helix-loop-helix DNA-binding domain-containing protein, partial [Mycena pura]